MFFLNPICQNIQNAQTQAFSRTVALIYPLINPLLTQIHSANLQWGARL